MKKKVDIQFDSSERSMGARTYIYIYIYIINDYCIYAQVGNFLKLFGCQACIALSGLGKHAKMGQYNI